MAKSGWIRQGPGVYQRHDRVIFRDASGRWILKRRGAPAGDHLGNFPTLKAAQERAGGPTNVRSPKKKRKKGSDLGLIGFDKGTRVVSGGQMESNRRKH